MDGWMEGPLTSVAYGWRLERADGVTLGFTSHDADVVHDGILLRASPGMQPTTVLQSAGLEKDGLDVSGALTAAIAPIKHNPGICRQTGQTNQYKA